jgi:hypothetical protein
MGIEARHAYRFGYLKSEHWQNLRIEKLAEEDACCFFCGHRDLRNDVHHVHYPDNLYEADTSMLRVLCREHHDMMHQFIDAIKEQNEKNGRPYDKSRGADFCIFRHAATKIENKMRSLGQRPMTTKGTRLEKAGPIHSITKANVEIVKNAKSEEKMLKSLVTLMRSASALKDSSRIDLINGAEDALYELSETIKKNEAEIVRLRAQYIKNFA